MTLAQAFLADRVGEAGGIVSGSDLCCRAQRLAIDCEIEEFRRQAGNGGGGVAADAVAAVTGEAARRLDVFILDHCRCDRGRLDADPLRFVDQGGGDRADDLGQLLDALTGRCRKIRDDRQKPVARQAALDIGQDLADAGEVLQRRHQGAESAPVMILAGAVLVQQRLHLSGLEQQAADQRSRQTGFACGHGGQVAAKLEQKPAAPADQLAELVVADQGLVWPIACGNRSQ